MRYEIKIKTVYAERIESILSFLGIFADSYTKIELKDGNGEFKSNLLIIRN